MKKLTATVLAVIMIVSLCTVFALADDPTNLAKGITVTDANGNVIPTYNNYTGNLTDGAYDDAEKGFDSPSWFCFYYNESSGVPAAGVNTANGKDAALYLDLGKLCTVDNIKLLTFVGDMWGIIPPASMTAYYSVDGTNYGEIATVELTKPTPKDETELGSDGKPNINKKEWIEFKADTSLVARYVRVDVKLAGVFAFFSELEVNGVEGGDPSTNPELPNANESSDDPAVDTSSEEPADNTSEETPADNTSSAAPVESAEESKAEESKGEESKPVASEEGGNLTWLWIVIAVVAVAAIVVIVVVGGKKKK